MIWPSLRYRDAREAIRFLVDAFGFEARVVVPGASDDVVEHAELRWPLGGGVMLGTNAEQTGTAAVYVVCDDPDALHARAVAAGAEVVVPLHDEPFGSRTFTVRDPEGHRWAFGTYAGE